MKFNQKLVLNRYLLSLFEVQSLEELSVNLKQKRSEGIDENGVSFFYHDLTSFVFENERLSKEQLLTYDNNIVRHTNKIDRNIKWKYFQYLSLLFIEIYLDMFFRDKKRLLHDLNAFLKEFNMELEAKERIENFKLDELNKLAFWNATGSGKTLLMHINYLQFKHYANIKINKSILITPNEGLSKQHLDEFALSNIEAEIFSKNSNGLFDNIDIEIIEISKLKDEDGDTTIAVDSFEDNNLVFIDEGHRGSSGDEWKKNRDKLSVNGFAFEYSATFGQSINSASGKKKEALANEYAKAILFDYSYKYFYNDGYGKNYSILNLTEDNDKEIKKHYLIASLLTFYQQIKIYKENPITLKKYNLENPLMVFVGASVNAVRTEQGKSVSDVVDALLFLDDFVKNSSSSIDIIQNILTGKSGLTNRQNEDIFENKFGFLAYKNLDAKSTYEDMKKLIFNGSVGLLHLDDLKSNDGEIGLRLGDGEYFGVINVGDTTKLLKLCEDNGLNTDKKDFSVSLFENINDKNSKINILIGSKKFTEGWSSWRVSIMGLLNMGKKEGSQIIQLFGRGVRLKGEDFSLKRSEAFGQGLERKIQSIETLYIFGLKANYMKQFKEYLEEEGMPVDERVEFILPVIYNKSYKSKKLKVIKLQDGKEFKKNKTITFTLDKNSYITKKVVLNLYSQVEAMESIKSSKNKIDFEEIKLDKHHFAFLDIDNIFFQMIRYKNERNFSNLSISKDVLEIFFMADNWYKLLCPKSYIKIDKFSDFKKIEEIVIMLLRQYMKAFYEYYKDDWEKDFLELKTIDEKDANLISHYKVEIEDSEIELIEKLKILEKELRANRTLDINLLKFKSISFGAHIYNPLIFKAKDTTSLTMKPVHLNEGEMKFIEDLKLFISSEADILKQKEIYLLRNQSKTGVGFFAEANFYPDFLMWIIDGNKQYINFIDPKGLVNENTKDSPKINFFQRIKEIESKICDKSTVLTSFIISTTQMKLLEILKSCDKKELEDKNVLFQLDDRDYIEKMFRKILI